MIAMTPPQQKMSTGPASEPRLLAGLIGALALVAVVVVVLAALGSGGSPSDAGGSGGRPAVADNERPPRPRAAAGTVQIKQASWQMEIFAVAGGPRVTEVQRRLLKAQKPRLRKLVRSTYNALFLEPGARHRAIAGPFSPLSTRAWLNSRAGLGSNAEQVRMVRRKASIGIIAGRADSAAAEVVIAARGETGPRTFHVRHRSTLWLERAHKSWRVIAFHIDQEPVT